MENRIADKYVKNSNNIKKVNFQFRNKISSPKYINNLIFNINISNLKNRVFKREIDQSKNMDNYARKIIIKNISRYDAKKGQIEMNIINNLIEGKSSHEKAILRDNNMFNNFSENLRAFYNMKKIIKIFPKFYIYYKNYFKFFLKPTFKDLKFCNILKKNGNNQAEDFYEKFRKKRNKLKIPNRKNKNYNKKIYLAKFIEKNSNNPSFNYSSENISNFKNINNNSGFSAISLLSIINLINNNDNNNNNTNNNKNYTSSNQFKKYDYFPKKINLFLEFKKENKKANTKSKKAAASVLTPTKINNVKIINSYDYKVSKPKINDEKKNNIKIIFKKDDEIKNDKICLSERTNVEKNYKNNYKNIFTKFKTKSDYQQLNDKQNLLSDTNNINSINKLYYNMKETSFTPTNRTSYQLTTQTTSSNWYNNCDTNSNILSQTQIKKIKTNSPIFRNYSIKNNFLNKIKSKNIKYNTNINNNSNNHINTMKLNFQNRNGFNSKSFIYYQKIKNDNNINFN